jgi:hypothetical protein
VGIFALLVILGCLDHEGRPICLVQAAWGAVLGLLAGLVLVLILVWCGVG